MTFSGMNTKIHGEVSEFHRVIVTILHITPGSSAVKENYLILRLPGFYTGCVTLCLSDSGF